MGRGWFSDVISRAARLFSSVNADCFACAIDCQSGPLYRMIYNGKVTSFVEIHRQDVSAQEHSTNKSPYSTCLCNLTALESVSAQTFVCPALIGVKRRNLLIFKEFSRNFHARFLAFLYRLMYNMYVTWKGGFTQ